MNRFISLLSILIILLMMFSCDKETDNPYIEYKANTNSDKDLINNELTGNHELSGFINFVNSFSGTTFITPNSSNYFLDEEENSKLKAIYNYKIFNKGQLAKYAAWIDYYESLMIYASDIKSNTHVTIIINNINSYELIPGNTYYCEITYIESNSQYSAYPASIKVIHFNDGKLSCSFEGKMYQSYCNSDGCYCKYATDIEGYFQNLIDLESILD